MENIIVIDKNKTPLGFLPKSKIDILLNEGKGLYRTNFLFQMKKKYKPKFQFYTMKVVKVNDIYQTTILNEDKIIFQINFKKLINVKLLEKYINIEHIYFDKINQDILNTFNEIRTIVSDLNDELQNEQKVPIISNANKINQEVKTLSSEIAILNNSNQIYKIYRYKFYLDANHAIRIDDKLGEIHPHTWEFAIELKHKETSLVLFTDIEIMINDILKPYQGILINQVAPFDTLNPTTENMGNYFKNYIKNKMYVLNWELLKLEISESPNRTYVI